MEHGGVEEDWQDPQFLRTILTPITVPGGSHVGLLVTPGVQDIDYHNDSNDAIGVDTIMPEYLDPQFAKTLTTQGKTAVIQFEWFVMKPPPSAAERNEEDVGPLDGNVVKGPASAEESATARSPYDADLVVAASSPAATELPREDLSVIWPDNYPNLVAQQVKSVLKTIIAMLRAPPRQPTTPQNLLWLIIHLIQTQLDRVWLHQAHLQRIFETGDHDVDRIKQAMDIAEHFARPRGWSCPTRTGAGTCLSTGTWPSTRALLADTDVMPPYMVDAVVGQLAEYAPADEWRRRS
ncbi:hypothetical protein GGF31_006784 [Allomyces arbusculus]|nr:hypothetical protein GGF31_006784 [Allomyces arbusculus]